MFQLAIALCHFISPSSAELSCTTFRAYTDDCAKTVAALKEQYEYTEKFIKLAACTKAIKHPKIQTETRGQGPGNWAFGT